MIRRLAANEVKERINGRYQHRHRLGHSDGYRNVPHVFRRISYVDADLVVSVPLLFGPTERMTM